MEKKTQKLKTRHYLIAKKLQTFQDVGYPTPKQKWWANLHGVSLVSMRKNFKRLIEHGCIVEVNTYDYHVTEKGKQFIEEFEEKLKETNS